MCCSHQNFANLINNTIMNTVSEFCVVLSLSSRYILKQARQEQNTRWSMHIFSRIMSSIHKINMYETFYRQLRIRFFGILLGKFAASRLPWKSFPLYSSKRQTKNKQTNNWNVIQQFFLFLIEMCNVITYDGYAQTHFMRYFPNKIKRAS